MLNVKCSNCGAQIDLDSPMVKIIRYSRHEIVVQCPRCGKELLLQLVSLGSKRYNLINRLEAKKQQRLLMRR